MARQFLSNSTPAEKYKFFIKGVQLEQLDHDYKLLKETIDQTFDSLTSSQDEVERLRDIYQKAKEKQILAETHNHVRAKVQIYQKQMAWAQVGEEEKV
jgi:chromosome segregation ATPase